MAGEKAEMRHGEFGIVSGEMTQAQFEEFLPRAFANLCAIEVDGSLHFIAMDRSAFGPDGADFQVGAIPGLPMIGRAACGLVILTCRPWGSPRAGTFTLARRP